MGTPRPARRPKAKAAATPEPAAKGERDAADRDHWLTELLEAVRALEGCAPAWISVARATLEELFPAGIGSEEVVVVPQIERLLGSGLGDQANGTWCLALARLLWADLKVHGVDGKRAAFPSHLARPAHFSLSPGRTHGFEGLEDDLDAKIERALAKALDRRFSAAADTTEQAFAERLRSTPDVVQPNGTAALMRSVDKYAEPPVTRLQALLGTHKADPSWPWQDPLFCERLAEHQAAKMLRGGKRATEYWAAFLHDKELRGCKFADEGMRYAFLFDLLVFEDRVTLQSRTLEAVCRILYGKEKALQGVLRKADWESKSKANYSMMDLYDLSQASEQLVAAKADLAVTNELKQRTEQAKWLSKGAAHVQ